MSKISFASFPGKAVTRAPFRVNLKWLCAFVVLVLLAAPGRSWADAIEDEYFRIHAIIQEADAMAASGSTAGALTKYRAAQTALQKFQRDNPDWKVKVVSYRWNYLTERITALSQAESPTGASVAGTGSGAAKGGRAAMKFKLLEPGAEPRVALRLHPKEGNKQAVSMTLKIASEMMGQTMKVPEINMAMDATVKSVSPDGDITYDLVIGDATLGDDNGAMPQVAEAMKTALASCKGMTTSGTVSSRGVAQTATAKAPAGADAQTKQVMDQMKEALSAIMVPLPEEAVGQGAKWEVKEPAKSGGISVDQTLVFELASIEGDTLTVKTTIDQHAGSQKIPNPAMPSAKIDLNKITGAGTGDATWDLGQLIASSGTLNLKSEQDASMTVGGQKQAMTSKLEITVKVEAK
jgi:hypothetical protein